MAAKVFTRSARKCPSLSSASSASVTLSRACASLRNASVRVLTGRAVKWISTRTEAFLSDAQARDNVTEAELALDKDGTFLGFRVKTTAAIGAYLQNNMPAFIFNAGTLAGVSRTPAMHVDITGVFTNTNPVRPYRGNGRP